MKIGLRRTTLLTSDILAALLATFITYGNTMKVWSSYSEDDIIRIIVMQVTLTISALIYFSSKGHYSWRNPWWQQVRQTLRTCFILILISLLVNVVAISNVNGFMWVTLFWGLWAFALLTFRWVGRSFLISQNHWDIPTVLVGGSVNLIETIYALRSEAYLRYNIKQVVLTDYTPEAIQQLKDEHGDLIIIRELGHIDSYSMVILCPDEFSDSFIKEVVYKVRASGARFAIVPPTNGFSLYGLQTQFFFGHKIVLLESRVRLQTPAGRLLKYITDKIAAFIAIVLLSPVFIIIALRVRKDGGPAFYSQERVGKNGKPFKCWKFRSMIVNSEEALKAHLAQNPEAAAEYERDFKLKDDPRITAVGKLLRKSSLDEIPQFFNVLMGDMSIVGPRPIVEKETHYYEDKLSYYLSVKPGVTGLWQVSGRNDISYAKRVELDVWYIENWSLWNDIVIFLETIYVVLARKGAY